MPAFVRTVLSSALLLLSSPAWAAPAEVALRISVAGTTVTVDGEVVAREAPQQVTLRLEPGRRVVRIERDGFVPFESALEVTATGPREMEALLLVAGAEPGRPRAGPAVRIAVQDLVVNETLDRRAASLLSDALLAEVRKLDRVSAISMGEVRDMLSFEQQRQLLGCDASACFAEIGGALGVDELVTGSIGSLGESQILTLRRVDMKAAVVRASVTHRFKSGDGEEFLALVGPAIAELFADYPLRPGRVRGVSQELVSRLNPPPLPTWAFYSTAGTAGAAAVVGGVFAALFIDAQNQYRALAQQSLTEPVRGSDLATLATRAGTNATAANVAFATAGALALAAGVEAFFTDWNGYRDMGTGGPVAAIRIVPTPTGVALAGAF